MSYEVKKVEMGQEFKVCPTCGYRDGFHSMFKRDKKQLRIFCICPSCHDIFDLDLSLELPKST